MGTEQSPANQAGGLFEFRHIKNPLVGYEATYSYNRGDQGFSNFPLPPCPTSGCTVSTASIADNAHEVTGDWVCRFTGRTCAIRACWWRALLNVPSGGTVTTTTCSSTNPIWQPEHIGCCDPHLCPRCFYLRGWPGLGIATAHRPPVSISRESIQSARDCPMLFPSTNAFTHTSEPVIGILFPGCEWGDFRARSLIKTSIWGSRGTQTSTILFAENSGLASTQTG